MANTSQPDFRFHNSRSSDSRFHDSTPDAFLRAATSPSARFSILDLSVSGFIACTICASLVLNTPVTAQADEKPAARKPVATSPANRTTPARPAKARPATKPAPKSAQVCVVKTTGISSTVARARLSPLQTLRPVAASSRRSSEADEAVAEERFAVSSESSTALVVEALPPAPGQSVVAAPKNDTRFAAAPGTAVTETTVTETTIAAGSTPGNTAAVAVAAAEGTPAETPVADSTPVTVEAPVSSQTSAANETTSGANEPLTGSIDFGAARRVPANSSAPSTPVATSPPNAPETSATPSTPAVAAQASRLYAPSISYEGGTIIAQGTPENPVRLESDAARIIAQSVRLDTVGKTVSASGKVRVERQVTVKRYTAFRAQGQDDESNMETVTETLEGDNFEYNYETRQGQLGATSVRLANFNISAESLTINGQKYVARNVIVRPGGLSEEELKIYGTPPFNLRLKEFTVDTSKPASDANVPDTESAGGASVNMGARTSGKGGALYFKNTRLLPVPSALFRRSLGRREEQTYQITPRIYYNSADGLLVTTKLFFPFSQQNPERLTLSADVGLSTKVGFRGGVELESDNRLGNVSVGARVNDVVSTQLTNRIELDRLPEIQYRTPPLRLLTLPGGRSAGLRFGFTAGDYRERFSDRSRVTHSTRYQGQVRFTTRLSREDGPYLDLFARAAKYSDHHENLSTAGYEIGYIGPITKWLAGQFSYSATNVSGSTPFRFDEIEIRKELRATFDVLLTPRYIVPIDLRYDVERGDLRDTRFGILRNYKTFAYGVTYQSARKEVKLEIRQGF